MEDLDKDLAVDPMLLDEDWLRQPGLYMKYSAMAADAQKRRDMAKEKLDVVKAELDKDIRNNPSKYGMDKVTENAVAMTIPSQQAYKDASTELIEAGYESNMLQAAVRAFDHRRSALENMVKLWLGSYYSGPKAPRDIPGGKRVVDMARDRTSSKMREEMNKSKEEAPAAGETPTRRRRG